ncbi:MAG TPA: hypothetical protein VLU38_04580 [Methanomassiliicoccales archaeon]|nr:hypothetical protein [Methanomassiliicoccales archaeon]
MAEERNTHVKLAMAEGLGLALVAYLTFMVSMWAFDQVTPGAAILGVAQWCGVGFLIVTVIAFLNENYLMSATFGILGAFTSLFPAMALAAMAPNGESFANGGMATLFVGVLLLLLGFISVAQPVRMVPVVLISAAIMFFFIGLWWGDLGNDTYKMLTGVFAFLTMLIALYLVAAIGLLVIKGKPVLPLLIKG